MPFVADTFSVTRDLSDTPQAIDQRGTIIVPFEVQWNPDARLEIRAKDLAYATPGPDEAQEF